jgi:hypothetical protein
LFSSFDGKQRIFPDFGGCITFVDRIGSIEGESFIDGVVDFLYFSFGAKEVVDRLLSQ